MIVVAPAVDCRRLQPVPKMAFDARPRVEGGLGRVEARPRAGVEMTFDARPRVGGGLGRVEARQPVPR